MSAGEIQDLASCRSNEQGNVLSWADTKDKWQLSNVGMRQLERRQSERSKFEFCDSDATSSFLVAFTERRPVEMASYVCKVHGGQLPVPKNAFENDVRSFECSQLFLRLLGIGQIFMSESQILKKLRTLTLGEVSLYG